MAVLVSVWDAQVAMVSERRISVLRLEHPRKVALLKATGEWNSALVSALHELNRAVPDISVARGNFTLVSVETLNLLSTVETLLAISVTKKSASELVPSPVPPVEMLEITVGKSSATMVAVSPVLARIAFAIAVKREAKEEYLAISNSPPSHQ
jgi:hypothetical protein